MNKQKCLDTILNEDLINLSSTLTHHAIAANTCTNDLYRKYLNLKEGNTYYLSKLDLLIRFNSIIAESSFLQDLIIYGSGDAAVVAEVTIKHNSVKDSIFDAAKKKISLKEFVTLYPELTPANKDQIDKIDTFASLENKRDELLKFKTLQDNYNFLSNRLFNM